MTSFLIPYICFMMHFNANGTDACNSALVTGSIQSGVKNRADQIEKDVTKEVIEVTGDKVWVLSLTAYKVLKDREILLNTNIKPLVDNLQFTIKDGTVGAKLSWEF